MPRLYGQSRRALKQCYRPEPMSKQPSDLNRPGMDPFRDRAAGAATWPCNKKAGQICLNLNPSVSDLESSSLAGFFAFIRPNLCTRHIPGKLTPRGHHDWPNKRPNRKPAHPYPRDTRYTATSAIKLGTECTFLFPARKYRRSIVIPSNATRFSKSCTVRK